MKKNLLLTSVLISCTLATWAQNNRAISRVLEYRPAPGQHINRLFPSPAMSDTYENALKFADTSLVIKKKILGLGAFGGYVVVGFDHPIVNVKGEYDFKALGNAFKGSSEPGIVMVCQDLNKNGKPDADEPWYELAGSEYTNAQTIKNYEVTYYRPVGKKQNVQWKDNQGGSGTVKHISFATQDYIYPIWVKEDSITFRGTKLRNTAHDTSGNGTYWVLDAFDWGYVDNYPNTDPIGRNGFKIDWAVDSNGHPVELAYIDFVKIQTAQMQEAGWLGETSTEVAGIEDLHPDAVLLSVENDVASKITLHISNGELQVESRDGIREVAIYNLQGALVKTVRSTHIIGIHELSQGIYIVRIIDNTGQLHISKILNK